MSERSSAFHPTFTGGPYTGNRPSNGWPVRDAPPEEGPALDPPPTHRSARSLRPHVPGPCYRREREIRRRTAADERTPPDPNVPIGRKRSVGRSILTAPGTRFGSGGCFHPAS